MFDEYEGKIWYLCRALVAPGGAWGVGKPISVRCWFIGSTGFDTTDAAMS